jgi:Cu/Ag efflux protein CusF
MVEYESINTRILGWIFIGGTAAVVVSIFAVWAFSNMTVMEFDAASRTAKANTQASERAAMQQASHPGYRFIDREAGKVSIPIEEAKRLIVRELTK